MTKKESVAKVIRGISVPPIMVSALILILANYSQDYTRNFSEVMITIFLLGVVPILAYPLQRVIPKFKVLGRRGQRKLAFITNLIGYFAAFLWSIFYHVTEGLFLVCATYFFSVILLTICNLAHFKASGHASSFTGPLVILIYSFGMKAVLPCVVIAGLIIWSSLTLKRHTKKELTGGIIVCLLSFLSAWVLINM